MDSGKKCIKKISCDVGTNVYGFEIKGDALVPVNKMPFFFFASFHSTVWSVIINSAKSVVDVPEDQTPAQQAYKTICCVSYLLS